MKKLFFLFAATYLLLSSMQSPAPRNSSSLKTTQQNLFTLADAEKILGEAAKLTDSSTAMKGNVLQFNSTFTAIEMDEKTARRGNVYFIAEQYTTDSSAHKVYASIKKMNESHEGIKTLENLGSEAYFHSDGENFYFIMVRKGSKMFRIKVNKVTAKSSLDAFNRISEKITAAL